MEPDRFGHRSQACCWPAWPTKQSDHTGHLLPAATDTGPHISPADCRSDRPLLFLPEHGGPHYFSMFGRLGLVKCLSFDASPPFDSLSAGSAHCRKQVVACRCTRSSIRTPTENKRQRQPGSFGAPWDGHSLVPSPFGEDEAAPVHHGQEQMSQGVGLTARQVGQLLAQGMSGLLTIHGNARRGPGPDLETRTSSLLQGRPSPVFVHQQPVVGVPLKRNHFTGFAVATETSGLAGPLPSRIALFHQRMGMLVQTLCNGRT